MHRPLSSDIDVRPGLQRARLRFPDLDTRGLKLIGWGAGYYFRTYYPQLDIGLAYTACVWEIETGQLTDGESVCGVPVHHADLLRDEDPDKVLIVIFSGKWFDCMRQIPAYGRFRMVRAIDEYADGATMEKRLLQFCTTAAERQPAASVGLVIQGPVMAGVTPRVLAANRIKFPFAYLVLSTWNDSDPALLAECAHHVDQIVTLPPPPQGGAFNAVMQRDSTRAGLDAMAARGIDYAFKSRTDQSITGAADPALLIVLAQRPISGAHAGGRQRIVFCAHHSWRFIPFHLTDQLQFGRVADLLEFWQCHDDSILGVVSVAASAPASLMSLCTPESMFVRCYLRRIGVGYGLTLASYWRICMERFALMPESVDLLNWKAVALFDVPRGDDPRAATLQPAASLMSTWEAADWPLADGAAIDAMAAAVDRIGLRVTDYAAATPFALPAVRLSPAGARGAG